jgi:hypothetical protein
MYANERQPETGWCGVTNFSTVLISKLHTEDLNYRRSTRSLHTYQKVRTDPGPSKRAQTKLLTNTPPHHKEMTFYLCAVNHFNIWLQCLSVLSLIFDKIILP